MSFDKNLSGSAFVIPELTEQARKIVADTPWPTTRMERWKYTRVSKLQKVDFFDRKSTSSNYREFVIDPDAITLLFVNGHFVEKIGNEVQEIGVAVFSMSGKQLEKSEIPLENDLFTALNVAYLTDGVQIEIPAKMSASKFQVIHILEGDTSISNFKTIINVGDFAEASFTIAYLSTESAKNCFANCTAEINVGQNAKLTIDKIQYENDSCYHIGSELVNQSKDSTFTINTITLNGAIVRNNLTIKVNGQNAETNLNGAAVLKGLQHIDNQTVVDHRVSHCNSNELYKGVVDDSATVVFNGKVFVRPDAQKINAFQSNANVLLSENATVNSKPELEIYADDVKCSHGSTTGQLDENAVFYLQARGLSKPKAKALLVNAFIGEVLERIENKHVRTFIDAKLEERFGWTL
jgi:Fe-S cluster assembly protein SufD